MKSDAEHLAPQSSDGYASEVRADRFSLAAALLAAYWNGLDDREHRILEARTFAASPLPLKELGAEFSLSRQRVQQIEKKCLQDLRSILESSELTSLESAIRAEAAPVMSLDRLLNRMPVLRSEVSTSGIPVWRLLQEGPDGHEILDGWCAVPNVAAARRETLEAFQDLTTADYQPDLLKLRESAPGMQAMAANEATSWLESCGLTDLGGMVIRSASGIPDRAAAVLRVEGEALTAQEIRARLGFERSLFSLKNALSDDDRFSRVSRDRWALRIWGLRPYHSIRQLIDDEIAAAGGQVKLEDLVANLSSQFDVKRNSLTIYASAHPFVLVDGFVRYRRGDEDDADSANPWQTARLFRRPDDWVLRVRVTHDHLRGSGSSIPVALARTFGLQPGGSMFLESDQGTQVISWSGLNPTLGSVRRLLNDFGEDDEVAFVFSDEQRFVIERLPNPTNQIESILAAAALRPQPPASPFAVLAGSIGCSADSQITHLVSALRSRGDHDLAELLEGI